jgi:hypothetical protein
MAAAPRAAGGTEVTTSLAHRPTNPPLALVDAVQANCHIADARHAADLPLCIYLLQMREFYRWERGLSFDATLDRDAVGQWLAQREALWSEVEDGPLHPLPFEGRLFEPQDADTLNSALMPFGLMYGAGITAVDRPTFFLARLHSAAEGADGLCLQVGDREFARGLSAPPAALARGRTIVLRRESLARWLWEKFEAFSLRRAEGPFKALADAYGLDDSASFVAALPRLVDELGETLLLHELGEYRAGHWLEPGWSAMRLSLKQRRTELHVRAVRDHIADLEVTLPALLERSAVAPLHFWFANYEGVRERLFPALKSAYAAWRQGDAGAALRNAARVGSVHFRNLAEDVLALHQRFGEHAGMPIDRLLVSPLAVCAA